MAQVKSNSLPTFARGMEVVYNLLKDGKPHSRAWLKSALAKHGIKQSIFGRCFRLGRILRKLGKGDVLISRNREDASKSTAQLITGAAAKKSIAEKTERYANLAGRSSKKSTAKKSAAKKSTAKTASKSKSAKKAAPKKAVSRKPVHVGADDDDAVLES